MLPVVFTPPTDLHRHILHGYVRAEWERIALFAWSRYQEDGRGFVYLNTQRRLDGGEHRPRYVTKTDYPFVEDLGFDLVEAVLTYEPERQAIVMVAWPFSSMEEKWRREASSPEEPERRQLPVLAVDVFAFDPPPKA